MAIIMVIMIKYQHQYHQDYGQRRHRHPNIQEFFLVPGTDGTTQSL